MNEIGLCKTCAFARRVSTARGSVFWRCGRADRDASYARYPRLPVLSCSGFEAELAAARGRAALLDEPDKP